jgi:hypothetical protein
MMLFVISTWDMATGILHLFNAFLKAEDPTVEFNKPSDWINVVRVCLFCSWVAIEQTLKQLARH